MEKKTLYALLSLVVLAGLAFVTLRGPEKGDRVGEKPRPVAEIKAGTITSLDITQPGGKDTVSLSKQGDKWQVTAPYNKPADQQAVKSAVEGLEKIQWGDITTQQKERHAEMEVSDDKAIHVVAKDSASKLLADLYLGKISGSTTMVRVAGKDDVWQANDLSTFNFKKEGKLWRDHTVFDLKPDEAEKVSIVGAGTSVSLERLPAAKGPDGKEGSSNIYDAKWKIVAGDDKAMKPQPGVAIDDTLINGIVSGVATLRAGDFADSEKPESVGLAPAGGQQEVKITFKGGKTAGVRIGQLKGDDWYVQALDAPQIFSVKKFNLERVAHTPQDVRDKTVAQLKEEDLVEIAVQQDKDLLSLKRVDKKWKADKVAEQDDDKVKGVADSFATLSGMGFVVPGAPELASLQKPRATVTLKPKAGAPVVIKIGDAKGEDVIVQKVGMEPVWLKKYATDRFLKKPADMAKEKK